MQRSFVRGVHICFLFLLFILCPELWRYAPFGICCVLFALFWHHEVTYKVCGWRRKKEKRIFGSIVIYTEITFDKKEHSITMCRVDKFVKKNGCIVYNKVNEGIFTVSIFFFLFIVYGYSVTQTKYAFFRRTETVFIT